MFCLTSVWGLKCILEFNRLYYTLCDCLLSSACTAANSRNTLWTLGHFIYFVYNIECIMCSSSSNFCRAAQEAHSTISGSPRPTCIFNWLHSHPNAQGIPREINVRSMRYCSASSACRCELSMHLNVSRRSFCKFDTRGDCKSFFHWFHASLYQCKWSCSPCEGRLRAPPTLNARHSLWLLTPAFVVTIHHCCYPSPWITILSDALSLHCDFNVK